MRTSTEPAAQSGVSLSSACAYLFGLSLRRQFLSRQTIACVVLTALSCLVAWGWAKKEPSLKKFAEEVLVPVHVSFLLPIFAVCYGAAAVGGEREDRSLVYLLITPMPRPLIYLMKYLSAIVLVLAWTMTSLAAIGFMARPWGVEAFRLFWPGILLGAVAYTSLFGALGAAFRRGTIISLAYALFLEVLLGNMPGIVKRVSVVFYIKCIIYDVGSEHQIAPRIARELFLPIAHGPAMWVLSLLAVGLAAAGLITFTRREYQDLS